MAQSKEVLRENIAMNLWDNLKAECCKCDWEVASRPERETFYDWADQLLALFKEDVDAV